MFTAYNKVRMHDIDMAGILYFPRQFRFVHDAFEDLLETLGISLYEIFKSFPFVFVIVHAEADYLRPLHVGDALRVELHVAKLGNSSFTFKYAIYRGEELTGTALTTHVALDAQTRTKINLPQELREALQKYTRA
jgi:1,4-dihydroxy-2-naphthoyl-CoA hydrolase